MRDTRKEFLLKALTGAAYAAPVVRSLAAPDGLLGQDHSETTTKGGMGKKGDEEPNQSRTGTDGIDSGFSSRTAPWQVPPPGGGGG